MFKWSYSIWWLDTPEDRDTFHFRAWTRNQAIDKGQAIAFRLGWAPLDSMSTLERGWK